MFCNLPSALRIRGACFYVIVCSSRHFNNGFTCRSFKTSEQFQGDSGVYTPEWLEQRSGDPGATSDHKASAGEGVQWGQREEVDSFVSGSSSWADRADPFCELPACLPSALLRGLWKKKACLSWVSLQEKSACSESSLFTSELSTNTWKSPKYFLLLHETKKLQSYSAAQKRAPDPGIT